MTCHLFIGNGDEPEALEYEYYGLYRLTNQELLTADDWALLPGYVSATSLARALSTPYALFIHRTGSDALHR